MGRDRVLNCVQAILESGRYARERCPSRITSYGPEHYEVNLRSRHSHGHSARALRSVSDTDQGYSPIARVQHDWRHDRRPLRRGVQGVGQVCLRRDTRGVVHASAHDARPIHLRAAPESEAVAISATAALPVRHATPAGQCM